MATHTYRGTNLDAVRTMGGVLGTCRFTDALGLGFIPGGTVQTVFADALGANVVSGMVQTRADGKGIFNGRCPQGEIITMFDLQIQGQEFAPNIPNPVATATLPDIFTGHLQNVSVRLNLRGQSYECGSPLLYPSQTGIGPNLPQNGGFGVPKFRLPLSTPIQIRSNDSYTIDFTYERQTALSAGFQIFQWQVLQAASTAVSLENLSGA